jgi:protein arginine kinase
LHSGAAVAFNRSKDTLLLLNDQEHFIFDYCGETKTVEKAIQAAKSELSIFEKKVDIAYSGRFGYVTSSPKNMGAAASVSVLMHLPFSLAHGLIELYPARADRAGVRFEPFCGRNIERHGFFRVSSLTTFGTDEQKITERVFEFASHLEKEEIRVRQSLSEGEERHLRKLMAQVLRHSTLSYRLSYTDVLRLFSFLSIGAELGEPGLTKLSPSAVIPGLTSPCIMGSDRKLYTVNECEKRRADIFADVVEKCTNPLLSSIRVPEKESKNSNTSKNKKDNEGIS